MIPSVAELRAEQVVKENPEFDAACQTIETWVRSAQANDKTAFIYPGLFQESVREHVIRLGYQVASSSWTQWEGAPEVGCTFIWWGETRPDPFVLHFSMDG